MTVWHLMLVVVLIAPAIGFASKSVFALYASADHRAVSWRWLAGLYVFTILGIGILIFIASALSGATGNEADIRAAFVWMVFKSGLFLAALGWLAPVVLTHRLIRRGSGPEAATRVWLAPNPFVVAALAVAGYFVLPGAA